MPSLDDIPLLMRVSSQLEAMHKHQREVAEALLGFLSRQEKREERSALQEDSSRETLEQIDASIASLGSQMGRIARVAAEALEAARFAGQSVETRLRALEDRTMVRRNQDRRGERQDEHQEDEETSNWRPPPRRGR